MRLIRALLVMASLCALAAALREIAPPATPTPGEIARIEYQLFLDGEREWREAQDSAQTRRSAAPSSVSFTPSTASAGDATVTRAEGRAATGP